jgi:hypothetical protein
MPPRPATLDRSELLSPSALLSLERGDTSRGVELRGAVPLPRGANREEENCPPADGVENWVPLVRSWFLSILSYVLRSATHRKAETVQRRRASLYGRRPRSPLVPSMLDSILRGGQRLRSCRGALVVLRLPPPFVAGRRSRRPLWNQRDGSRRSAPLSPVSFVERLDSPSASASPPRTNRFFPPRQLRARMFQRQVWLRDRV